METSIPTSPRPLSPAMVRHWGAREIAHCVTRGQPFISLGFGFRHLQNKDRDTRRALPTCKYQVRVLGPFPRGLCAPSVPQPGSWLVRDIGLVSQLQSNSPGSWVGVWAEPADWATSRYLASPPSSCPEPTGSSSHPVTWP